MTIIWVTQGSVVGMPCGYFDYCDCFLITMVDIKLLFPLLFGVSKKILPCLGKNLVRGGMVWNKKKFSYNGCTIFKSLVAYLLHEIIKLNPLHAC